MEMSADEIREAAAGLISKHKLILDLLFHNYPMTMIAAIVGERTGWLRLLRGASLEWREDNCSREVWDAHLTPELCRTLFQRAVGEAILSHGASFSCGGPEKGVGLTANEAVVLCSILKKQDRYSEGYTVGAIARLLG